MTNQDDNSPAAIPTVYRGIQLKSRMEAQCAVLFDKLGWEWEYEPFSLMLPSGLTYIPDFWINSPADCVVECRGYESERGNRQIDEFADLAERSANYFELPNGDSLDSFLVIGPKRVAFYKSVGYGYPDDRDIPATKREDYKVTSPIIYHCKCGWQVSSTWCPNCEQFASAAIMLSVNSGKILVNGVPVEDWNSPQKVLK